MKLSAILGHSAPKVTLRDAHLQPGNFTDQELALVDAARLRTVPLKAPQASEVYDTTIASSSSFLDRYRLSRTAKCLTYVSSRP